MSSQLKSSLNNLKDQNWIRKVFKKAWSDIKVSFQSKTLSSFKIKTSILDGLRKSSLEKGNS